MVIKEVRAYAQTVTSQENPNTTQLEKWSNISNAIGRSEDISATSQYTKKKKYTSYKDVVSYDKNGKKITKKVGDKYEFVYNRPWTIAGHNFGFNIPSKAYIKSVRFDIRIKVDKNVTTVVPKVRFNVYGTTYANRTSTPKNVTKTGFNGGVYFEVKSSKIPSQYSNFTFTMDEKVLDEAGVHDASVFNDDGMGIDLLFNNAEFKGDNESGKVYLDWIRCHVEYEEPNPVISIHNPALAYEGTGTSENDYYWCYADKPFDLEVHCDNKTKADGGSLPIHLDIPFGTDIQVVRHHGGYNTETNTWTINQDPNSYKRLYLKVTPHKAMDNVITVTGDGSEHKYFYYVIPQKYSEYDKIDVSLASDIRKGHLSCLEINIEGVSIQDYVNVTVTSTGDVTGKQFELNGERCTNVDKINSQSHSSGTSSVQLKVNGNERYVASLRYCFVTFEDTQLTFTVDTTGSSASVTKTFSVLSPYTYRITSTEMDDATGEYYNALFGTDVVKFVSHRVDSTLDMGANVFPCKSDDVDAIMIMSDCRINMGVWEDLDYIGCIPLEQTHFNPKSTFKDTLLNSTYKNKRYMGKKLATDEDITLNVRLHPHQVTTLQGLIEMDKPIPINANHKCFEGDSLNHRGWAEVYAVKTEQTGNNPHWYKCDIDVKYLTHNLNTRFKIDKGTRVSDYKIPSLLTETYENGTNLSDTTYFNVETDGTFYYADNVSGVTIEENDRNNFSIDNKQYITITTANPLTHTSQVAFTWSSTLLSEIRENNVSRIVRLYNKATNKLIFDYEYHNIQFDDDEVTADVIYRVYDEDSNVIDDVQTDLTFRYNPSDVTLEDSDTTVESDDDLNVIETGVAHYGTTLHLNLNNGKLSIIDEGFNGKEISVDNIQLVDTDYYYQVEWINNNSDAETNTVDCIFDFQVQDTILTSTYADTYGKLIVSPFPVSDKNLLFTREAEEGTIYYYKDDGEEFSYLVEPYYQYLNGTDLVTSAGSSIFNLNYGYEVVYIQNGLVRLGFNRLSGYMYLGKYDVKTDKYITTHTLKLDKYDDINLNNISDDKIEIQASDCTFTIYRGHPYIKIKHELEDIWINTRFNRVWAEQVGSGNSVDLPSYWELLNESNLLPSDVGGQNTIKTTNLTISDETVDRTDTTLSASTSSNQVYTDTDVTYTLTDTALSEYTDTVKIDGSVCSFGEYTWDVECDNTPVEVIIDGSNGVIQSGDSTTLYSKVSNVCGKGVANQLVKFYEIYTPLADLSATKNIIQSGDTTQLNIKLKDSEDGSQIPLDGKTVRIYEEYTPQAELSASKNVIQSGGTTNLQIKLKDTSDGSIVSVDGMTVRVYEEYTPNLRLTCSPSIIQSGSSSTPTATMYDLVDGNKVPVENVTVDFYTVKNGVSMFDGTETFSRANDGTGTLNIQYTSDNELKYTASSGVFFHSDITFGSDNNWECSFKFKADGNDGGRIGLYTTRTTNAEKELIAIKTQNAWVKLNTQTGIGSISTDNIGSYYANYKTLKISVVDDTANIYLDGSLQKTVTLDWLHEELCLGLHGWTTGNVIYIKDFLFEEK